MSLSGRGGVFVGTIWADVTVQGQAQAQAQLTGLTKTAGGTAESFLALGKMVLGAAAAYGVMREAIAGWKEMIAEDKALRGAVAQMQSLGEYSDAAVESVKGVADYWELFGKKQEETLPGFTQLLGVVGDVGIATNALNTAVKVSLVTHNSMSTVLDAMAKSFGVNDTQIRKLLLSWNAGAKEAKGFAEMMNIAGIVGQNYADQMNPAEQAQIRFNKAFKDLKVEVAEKAVPVMIPAFQALTEYIKILGVTLDANVPYLQKWAAYLALIVPGIDSLRNYALGNKPGQTGPDIGNVPWSMVPRNFTGPLGPGQVYEPPPGPGKSGKAEFDREAWDKWVAEQTAYGKLVETRTTEINERMNAENDERLKRMQDSWDKAHAEMFTVAQTFSSGVGDMFYQLAMNGQTSFASIARYWESLIAQMVSKMIASRLMDWLGGSIRAGKFGGGARPYQYVGSDIGGGGDYVNTGFGGYTPVGPPRLPGSSRGLTVIIPATSLLDAFNGSTVRVQNGLSVRIVNQGVNTVSALS